LISDTAVEVGGGAASTSAALWSSTFVKENGNSIAFMSVRRGNSITVGGCAFVDLTDPNQDDVRRVLEIEHDDASSAVSTNCNGSSTLRILEPNVYAVVHPTVGSGDMCLVVTNGACAYDPPAQLQHPDQLFRSCSGSQCADPRPKPGSILESRVAPCTNGPMGQFVNVVEYVGAFSTTGAPWVANFSIAFSNWSFSATDDLGADAHRKLCPAFACR